MGRELGDYKYIFNYAFNVNGDGLCGGSCIFRKNERKRTKPAPVVAESGLVRVCRRFRIDRSACVVDVGHWIALANGAVRSQLRVSVRAMGCAVVTASQHRRRPPRIQRGSLVGIPYAGRQPLGIGVGCRTRDRRYDRDKDDASAGRGGSDRRHVGRKRVVVPVRPSAAWRLPHCSVGAAHQQSGPRTEIPNILVGFVSSRSNEKSHPDTIRDHFSR